MRQYVDNLYQVLLEQKAGEEKFARERVQLIKRLEELYKKYNESKARIVTLWTSSTMIIELDVAFPRWKGQY